MRPLELELEGFTSFRARTTIDFRGLDLFAITGPTGSGKTSLLEAMIYALYGKAPRLEKDLNQLISRGKQTMRVRLDFAIGSAVHRVVRSATLSPKGVLTSKAGLDHKENGTWRSLAGKSNEVDRAVERLIGLDYDSFTRAVVLPQGQFDSFLKGDLRENTEVLNRLLRTGIYARVRQLAAERAAAGEQKLRDLDSENEKLAFATPEARAASEAALERLAAQARALATVDEELARTARAAEALAHTLAEVERLRGEAARHAAAHRAAGERLAGIHSTLETGAGALTAIETALAKARHDETRYVAFERAEGDATRLADVSAQLARAAESEAASAARLAVLATKIEAAALTAAERERASAEAAAKVATARAARDAIGGRFLSARAIATHLEIERSRLRLAGERAEKERALAGVRAGLAESAAQLETARAAARAAAAAVARSEEEIAALRRTHAAHELRAHLTAGTECPVCAQPVGRVPRAGPRPTAITAAEKALGTAREQARAAESNVVRLETAIAKDEEKAKQITLDAARLAADEDAAAAKLEAYLGRAPTAGTGAALEAALMELETAESTVASEEATARKRAEEVAAARREAEQLASAREVEAGAAAERARHRADAVHEHEEIRARLASMLGTAPDIATGALVTAARDGLAAARRAKKEHDELVARRDALRGELEHARADEIATRVALAESERNAADTGAAAESAAAGAAERRRALAAAAAALGIELTASADGTAERAAVESRRAAAGQERADVAARRAVAERELEDLDRARTRRGEVERQRAETAGATALAVQLARDLQADKFVTYLHEEAVDVLAADANRHLKTFLDMNFSLVFENRRFSIIDHANADERRSVRTLSGGESFTASLALAIGFAERLAELAGAASRPNALESLFLDEGFGTLDDEHLDHVANAIEALYGRGRTVGIITHIRELAQRMPARIIVSKQGNASSATIETG
jgi:exonuclease SbcC